MFLRTSSKKQREKNLQKIRDSFLKDPHDETPDDLVEASKDSLSLAQYVIDHELSLSESAIIKDVCEDLIFDIKKHNKHKLNSNNKTNDILKQLNHLIEKYNVMEPKIPK